MKVLRAQTHFIANINALIRRSKSIWNYSPKYLEAALPLLTINEEYLSENLAFQVHNDVDELIAFFAISEKDGDRYLDHLWVEPTQLGQGIGRLACEFIFQLGLKKGWRTLFVLPDLPAVRFYEKLGFESTLQTVPSQVTDGPVFVLYRKTFSSVTQSNRLYNLPFFKENRQGDILHLIQHYSLATLIGCRVHPMVSHLPLTLDYNERGEKELIGHMAKNNPHWKYLAIDGICTAIFQGPHAYITPSWYEPKESNVPTWNYAVVHATGTFKIINDPSNIISILEKQIKVFEALYQTDWKMLENSSSVLDLVKHIVAFKITNLTLEAKFKLSQQQNLKDRNNVIKELKEKGNLNLAQYMENDFK